MLGDTDHAGVVREHVFVGVEGDQLIQIFHLETSSRDEVVLDGFDVKTVGFTAEDDFEVPDIPSLEICCHHRLELTL